MFENEKFLIRIAYLAGTYQTSKARQEAMACACRTTRMKALSIIGDQTTAISPNLARA